MAAELKFIGYFILDKDGKTPIACQSADELIKWSQWMQDFTLRVVQADKIGDVWISTVFLGLNHGLIGDKKPVLWETLITATGNDKDLDDQGLRYTSLEEAIAGHQDISAFVQNRQQMRQQS